MFLEKAGYLGSLVPLRQESQDTEHHQDGGRLGAFLTPCPSHDYLKKRNRALAKCFPSFTKISKKHLKLTLDLVLI